MAIKGKQPKEIEITLRTPHDQQARFINSRAKRKIVKAGRRGGKTVGMAILACQRFLDGQRVLYAAPTTEQTDRFWYEVTRALAPAINAGVFEANKGERFIERPGTTNRIKAKTAWNADTLRGDFADFLILDEFQLTNEDAWGEVGAPILMDNNGDAVFIFTPPSLASTGVSKAKDPRHASKMYKVAGSDKSGRWEAYHFTSHDNPYLSIEGLEEVTRDMTPDAYRREILAEDDEIESSWLVLGKFNFATQLLPHFEPPKTWPLYTGHDFGSANPAAIFVAQNPATGDFTIFREYAPGPGRSMAQHVDEWKRITDGYQVIRRVGGNQTTEDEIRQGYGAHGWHITAPKITKVNAQLDRLIGMIPLNKVFVTADCPGVINTINNAMWELDNENKPLNKVKDEARHHLLATMRYLFSDFTPETESGGGEFRVFSFGRR